ncbi:MAG: hypothetical protein ABSH42_18555 [Bryobacteraceae bacterium]|jgi:hypothetical protein
MHCDLREQLADQYLRVLDLVDRARHALRVSVTQTNIECATTELRRVEEYRHDLLREIAGHCEDHACGTAKLERICGLALVSRETETRQPDSREMVA